MPITFALKIVRLTVYMSLILSQLDDLNLHSRSQRRLKLDKHVICTINTFSDRSQYLSMIFKLGMTVDLCMVYADAHFDDLDAMSKWIGREEKSA